MINIEDSRYEDERREESEDDSIHQAHLQRNLTFASDATDLGLIEMEPVNRPNRSKQLDLGSNSIRQWHKKTALH